MKKREAQPIGNLVLSFLRSESLESPLNERRLINAWSEVMGPTIASYTRDISIKNQVLFVHLSSAVLRQELMMERKRLVQRLNEHVKAQVITDIVIR
ncbi:MAG: DUF721 domain-containing protein [Bacteroidaceae bacterium]|nr:DUF721 domain-containing protein [Bacteroidaceae bacterium]MBQ9883383.1 DUF721 domain-containing protein [Bacteroidaceae bacterium]